MPPALQGRVLRLPPRRRVRAREQGRQLRPLQDIASVANRQVAAMNRFPNHEQTVYKPYHIWQVAVTPILPPSIPVAAWTRWPESLPPGWRPARIFCWPGRGKNPDPLKFALCLAYVCIRFANLINQRHWFGQGLTQKLQTSE